MRSRELARTEVLRRVRGGALGERARGGPGRLASLSPPRSAGSSPFSSPTSSASRRLSESRDAEEVRELLSRYFDTCRRLIELYGGTVEKFIGDAVMAVWGTPTATEDDAERAVRAALDLVAAVSALGDEVGAPELAAPRRRSHGRGCGDPRRGGPGHGRGRSRQHGRADPVRGESGHRVRGRVDEAGERADDRVRGRGNARAQGQGGAGSPPPRAPGRLGAAGSAEVERARAAVRRSRPRAPPRQGALPCLRRRAEAAPRLDHGHRRDREVATWVGVLQVLRRTGRHDLLAPRPLPCLRRGSDLLGARGHGSHAGAHLRGRRRRDRALQAARRLSTSTCWTQASGGSSSRCSAPARRSRKSRCRTNDTTCSLPGGSSSSGSPTSTPPSSCSRTCNGRTRASSTSSSTSSSGRARARSSCSPFRGPSCWRSGRAGAPVTATSLRFTSMPSPERRWASCWAVRPGTSGGAPRADPCACGRRAVVRRRDSAHAARPRPPRPGGRRLSADGRDPLTRGAGDAAGPRGVSARRPRRRGAAPAPGRRGHREDVHPAGARRGRGVAETELETMLTSLVRKEILGVQADPTSPEHGQYGFLQDLVRHVAYETLSQARAPGAAPRSRRVPVDRLRRGGGRGRRGDRVALPFRRRGRPGRRGRRGDRAKAQAMLARAGGRAESLAAAAEARRYFEQAAELTAVRRTRRSCSPGR